MARQSHWWTGLEHCLHKHFLMIGQPQVEAAVLEKVSTEVHYGENVVSISENEECVVVMTDLGRTIRARYAIGADGARSMVRNSLGIPFTGTKPEMIWAVLDTFIDTDFPVCNEIVTFQLNEQSRVSWIPRERGMARFYVLLDGEITQEKAEASIREHMTPHRVDFKATEWFSTFESTCNSLLVCNDADKVPSQGANCFRVRFERWQWSYLAWRRCGPRARCEWRTRPEHRNRRRTRPCLALISSSKGGQWLLQIRQDAHSKLRH